jgi:hypothetical protein
LLFAQLIAGPGLMNFLIFFLIFAMFTLGKTVKASSVDVPKLPALARAAMGWRPLALIMISG